MTSGRSTPDEVIASESSAGCGMAAELSPLETAVPSCALRDARSASPGIFPTVCLAGLTRGETSLQSQVSSQYISLSELSIGDSSMFHQ